MVQSLHGKIALVTGASRGIGKVIALQLARDGATVIVSARTETPSEEYPGSIHETVEMINAAAGRSQAVKLDVTDDDEIRSVLEQILSEHERIDILVNNAGALGGGGPFLGGDIGLLDHFYRTNLRAPYLLTQLVGETMAERGGGVIFNISSGLARLPDPSGGAGPHRGPGSVYGASKAALDRFAAGVAPELREKNIAIINIYPGFTVTERMLRMLPAGADTSRMQKPETTAAAISILCHDPMPHSGRIVVAKDFMEAQ
jgi:NAD(P)-dependent dehydrogenase (short-subunit alcohol dehydrogenase family)|tara:strand:+ start:5909 stop:6685 length:777 start_codon:yes stop_codon:yes gene_type:complete